MAKTVKGALLHRSCPPAGSPAAPRSVPGSGVAPLRDAPFLPVVHRADARRLLGMLSLDDFGRLRRASVKAAR